MDFFIGTIVSWKYRRKYNMAKCQQVTFESTSYTFYFYTKSTKETRRTIIISCFLFLEKEMKSLKIG